MSRKKLLTTEELIKHMRDKKGIKFNIVNEADAEHFCQSIIIISNWRLTGLIMIR